ncbi:MAG: hypothetical protein V3U75_04280 [Methylococcaceae bacterium]
MADHIITKRCFDCKKNKPLTEYHKNCATKDGYQDDCKCCRNKRSEDYRKTTEGKIYNRKYMRKYNKTEKRKTYFRNYRTSENYKTSQKNSHEKSILKTPERFKARSIVSNAVATGKLASAKTLTCSCGEQAEQYHHHKGYAKEHWLDVIAVCMPCHSKLSLLPDNVFS